jgi:hypothetical protein
MALTLTQCAAQSRPGPPASPAQPVSRAAPAAAFHGEQWDVVQSLRFSLVVPLPERSSWSVDDQSGRWLVAAHPPTQSQLKLRTWAAPRLVRPDECAAQVRLWTGETPDQTGTLIEQRELAVPAGFRTALSVGLKTGAAGQVEGHAVAFGAAVGRCFGAIYTTSAAGEGAVDVIGRRLAVVVEGILARLKPLAIDDRPERTR